MKRKNILQTLACGAAIFALAACTDVWDEHYQSNPDLNAEENLWELISGDDDLQEFTAFLQATKYDSLLMMNRNYTVWAPVDGSGCCDTAMLRTALQSKDKDSLLAVYRKEIVENHIANFSHVAGDIRDQQDKKNYERISMLNGKLYHFEGSPKEGVYKFSGIVLKNSNGMAKNGVLHKLDGSVAFAANLWEQLQKEAELDSLWRFLSKDYKRTVNTDKSVYGPVVAGSQEILDTAWDISCRWFYELAQFTEEDSSYTMYALNNAAWRDMYSMVKSYYNYSSSLQAEDKRTSAAISDSIVKEMMCRNLVFSNTVNKKYFEGLSDTLRSTTYRMFKDNQLFEYNNEKILVDEALAVTDPDRNGLEKEIPLSNGTLNIVSKVNYRPWIWGYDTIRIEGDALSSGERYDRKPDSNPKAETALRKKYRGFLDARQRSISVPRDSVFYHSISGHRFGYYEGVTETGENKANPTFNFYIDNVLSASYCVKIVLLPSDLMKDTYEGLKAPNKFQASLEYLTASGEARTQFFEPEEDYLPDGKTKIPVIDGVKCFISNPDVRDTIVLTKSFPFPICEAQLSRINSAVQVRAKLHIEDKAKFGNFGADNKGTDKKKWKYDNSYRIDEVIFEPLPFAQSEN